MDHIPWSPFPTTPIGGGSDNEQQHSHSHDNDSGGSKDEEIIRCTARRHTPYQIARLERMYKECAHPDENQRREIGVELGLDPAQIKFWFQNKRTKVKTLSERFDNNALRNENEKMRSENFMLREALKNNVFCSSCHGHEKRYLGMQRMRQENAILHQEIERVCRLLASEFGINMLPAPTLPSSHDPSSWLSMPNRNVETPTLTQHINPINVDQDISTLNYLGHVQDDNPALAPMLDQDLFPNILNPTTLVDHHDVLATTTRSPDQDISSLISAFDQDISTLSQDNSITPLDDHQLDVDAILGNNDHMLPHHPVMNTIATDTEKALMVDIANSAMDELVKLLCMNEPFWFRSMVDGKFILQRGIYERTFHRSTNCLKGLRPRIESSKDSQIVSMPGTQLVDMFLNSDKWVDLFPTIVKRAQTIQVLQSGLSGSQSGALQLMNAEMHILSPLVPAREFVFLRYCKQLEAGAWVIADVSFDFSIYDNTIHAWRFPSGCLIHEFTNGSCKVTWVEHVEVDDKMQTDRLFREVICGNYNAYGAERWVLTLERMCERFASASLENIPSSDTGGVISSGEGRRSVMELAHRMVKMFCGTLDMSGNLDVPYLTRQNNGGFRVSVHNSTGPGAPDGMIISAATSFRLPLSPRNVFDFLKDNSKRVQWDILCHGNPVQEIQRISTGTHPANSTSIIRPFVPKENEMLILQESYIDRMGSMLVYAPIGIETLNVAIRGEDSSELPLLPSGFTISADGRRSNAVSVEQSGESEGSLVTLVYQVLACTPSAMDNLDMESIASVNTLVTSTVEKIKVALNCSNLE